MSRPTACAARPVQPWRLLLVLAGLWAVGPSARARTRAGRTGLFPYVVVRGDSCWRIAEKLFGDGRKYRIIHRYNRLGPLPHLLKPGQRLWVPRQVTGPLAHLTWLLRDVEERSARALDWRHARKNQGLWKLHRVATGAASSARIEFLDASRIRMRPEALLVIYGGASHSAALRGRRPTTVVLRRGTLRGGLARMDREAGLVVRTPSSRLTLRSTLSQVEVSRLKTSIVSVYEGIASVFARGKRVRVPKDHGTWTRLGRRPARPVPLPAPPRWAGGPSAAVPPSVQIVLVPSGISGTFEARWLAAPRAHRYRVEVAEDPRFNRILVDAEVGAQVRRFAARDLRPGTYYARVSVRDRHRLESRPGPTLAVRLVPVHTSRRLHSGRHGVLEVPGLVQIQPPRAAGPLRVSVDGAPARAWTHPVTLVRPGLHHIRYGPRGTDPARVLAIRLIRVTGRIQLPARPIPAGARGAPVTVRLTDTRDRPASLPGLRLRTPWSTAPLSATAPGAYRTTLSVPATWVWRRAPLRLEWAAGVLARAALPVRPASPRRAPPRRAPPPRPTSTHPFFWHHRPVGLGWAETPPGQLGEPAEVVTSVGLSTYLADGPLRQTGRDRYLVSALRGRLALVDKRLGITARLPWFDGPVTTDRSGVRDIGDLTLHVLGVAWRSHGFTLSPAFGTVIPTGAFPRDRADTRFEPAVRFEWTYVDGLTLGTNQLVSIGVVPEQRSTGAYAASYHVTWQPLRWLTLGAELDAWIGLFGPDPDGSLRAVGLSGAVWFNLGRGRIGLLGGGGLNRDAWDLLGRYRVGITADLGFQGL